MRKQYKATNGTSYDINTSTKVIEVLEHCRLNDIRIVLDYGCTETGESWGEVNDIVGRVGRSMGPLKVPLLIHNKRSLGGGEIMTSSIIGIRESKGGKVLYKLTK